MTIKHSQVDIYIGQIVRDGDFDAVLTKSFIVQPNTDYVIWHKLGRMPRQISIVWKDALCDWKVAKDAKGQPMQDTEKVVLNFSGSNVNLLLRIA